MRDVFSKKILLNERLISIIVFSLFFSWLLALPFEGQVLYALAEYHNIEIFNLIFGCIITHFFGLIICWLFIKTIKAAKLLMIFSIVFCIATSAIFFFSTSILWYVTLTVASFLSGACIAAWGFFLKSGTPSSERIKTVADGLICSNILMIIINMSAVHISPNTGLSVSILMLIGALFFATKLPEDMQSENVTCFSEKIKPVSITKPLAFLCLFIIVITINSGLMYQVLNPAFAHHDWLVSWYWAMPYIVALFIMRNLPRKTDRTYILYVAIAMIGFSFIAFMILDRSVSSYLLINTLMLGACGVYDLFLWSILGEMLDFNKNPAKVLGIGISANVLGVLLGGMIGNFIMTLNIQNYYSSVIALIAVFATLLILPLLHSQLSILLKNHAYLTVLSKMSVQEQVKSIDNFKRIGMLTDRESQIVELLMKGRTYKMIASELYLSENTIKTHIKNIYSKLHIKSKPELIKILTQ